MSNCCSSLPVILWLMNLAARPAWSKVSATPTETATPITSLKPGTPGILRPAAMPASEVGP